MPHTHYMDSYHTIAAPVTRVQMAGVYDNQTWAEAPHTTRVDYLAPALFNILLQLKKGPAYVLTGTTIDDNGFDTMRVLREQFGNTKRQTISVLS